MTNTAGFHLYEEPRVTTFIKTKSRMVVTRKWKRGRNRKNEELLFNGYEASVLQNERVWRLFAQQCDYT